MKHKANRKFWASLLLLSLTGQVAWVMENMYLNVFIYKIFAASAGDISLMVAASAITATVTTILMGALSDRIGKRKLFICGGYIAWGISIIGFSLIRMEVPGVLFSATLSSASAGIAAVIAMDCVMTFFGSTANDAAFNAWLTDSTHEKNRGAAEGLNAMMPLVAILAVFGGFMFLDLDRPASWTVIFAVIGGVVLLVGLLGFWLIEEPATGTGGTGYIRQVLYGFTPTAVRENRRLYGSMALFTVFNISIQIFMPYLIIYYEVSLGMADYVFVMAPAILLAAVVTALWGRVYDKRGFRPAVLVPLLLLLLGYGILFFTRTRLPVFIGSLLMLSGYLAGGAAFGAKLRTETPAGRSGALQGIRICTQVLLPGIIGPYIGKAVLAGADTVVGGDGTESFIPSANIFLAAAVPALLLLLAILLFYQAPPRRQERLTTPYEPEDPPYAEHPDPLMRRDSFICLNGRWHLTVTRGRRVAYVGEILVPFPPESPLSGVERITKPRDLLIYERTFRLEKPMGRILLHFGAVDNLATVAVNGIPIGEHTGGYLPFTFDITEALRGGENVLTVKVTDATDPTFPYGKQCRHPHGMWYTPVSGIWQTVWLEAVPNEYIRSLSTTVTLHSVTVKVTGGAPDKCLILNGERYPFTGERVTVEVAEPRLWTPETPHLYDFAIESGEDRVTSYFALREIGTAVIGGQAVLTLNGKPYFFHGLLDQGYYPDGLFLPGTSAGYTEDIRRMKALGFNMLRKHIKIEPRLFYYNCDRYGMLVCQDMVNNGRYSFLYDTALPTIGAKKLPKYASKRVQEAFYAQAEGMVRHLHNHPSVVYYTIFNEGWGQHGRATAYQRMKALDPSRLYDTASGWFRVKDSDVQSEHVYFKKAAFRFDPQKPVILSEFGGYACAVSGHMLYPDKVFGYKKCPTPADLTRDLATLYRTEILPLVAKGMSGAVLTQVSDVEEETNGLLTYDRRVTKPDPAVMQAIAEELLAAHAAFCKKQSDTDG